MSVIEGPLEPPATAAPTTDAPEDSLFVNFFSASIKLGINAPNLTNSIQPYHSISTAPASSHAPAVVSAPAPTPPVPSHTPAPPSLDSLGEFQVIDISPHFLDVRHIEGGGMHSSCVEMAALRRLIIGTSKPSSLLISHRGIASKLFVGGLSIYTTEKGHSDAFSQYGQVMEGQYVI
ncbi:RNA binding family protein isoform 7 [Hibiscus syriacus]|uniref:RNA binding family protein isoform 7 n=1 Tax=Hibiscus syriacus TaxID=106335 RepID=A0A6A2Y8K6_HIBSY|nr:RNA binding family protein isoform 7 [Hibiscus syriacus]